MKDNKFQPKLNTSAFACPFCQAYAKQSWQTIDENGYEGQKVKFALCDCCYKKSLWLGEKMIYPKSSNIPMPNEDLNQNIIDLYNQARNIYNDSPRGACALLRLCVQQLCVQLGEKGKDLNTDIKNLVSKGLSPTVQQSLDIVRVVGNNSVHPGLINIEDNLDMAVALFSLINFIAEKMITEPKELSNLYQSLPISKLEEIKKRDNPS